MTNKLIINIIKTDIGKCFISDCHATTGYELQYHRTALKDIYFDGETPQPTYMVNWFEVKKYPEKVQKLVNGERINERYELVDKEMESKKLPLLIARAESKSYDEDILSTLYKFKYDALPKFYQDIDCELVVLCEVENYKDAPIFSYEITKHINYEDKTFLVTNKNVKHSLADQIILPEPLLANSPCSVSSVEMYDITRQFIKNHIDNKFATISSDYDFCFKVEKVIQLLEPETISYQNYFAKTKKERGKIHFATKTTKKTTIFQMTHDRRNYQGYTPIKAFTADNQWLLKQKIDDFLNDLISVINKPLHICPACNGTGYADMQE